jgi:L-alanine-DL-glutamate epimerase-like enolase superfamily enzyme
MLTEVAGPYATSPVCDRQLRNLHGEGSSTAEAVSRSAGRWRTAEAGLRFRGVRRAGPRPGDQPLRAAERQILKSPLHEHQDAALKINQVRQVDEERSIDETLEIGYRAFKVKVGRYSLEDDAERIEFGRKTAGKDIRIMVDANQAFNRTEALRRGRVYQELGCFWYEEPLPPWDHEGYAELAGSLDMRIATGENEYNKHAFMDLLLKKGADVVQPDNRRAGGPTEWIEIGAIADGFGVELASHGGGPVDMNILCAIPNAIYMESGGKQKLVNGEVLAPETPGMSSELKRDFITKHKIT